MSELISVLFLLEKEQKEVEEKEEEVEEVEGRGGGRGGGWPQQARLPDWIDCVLANHDI